MTKFLIYLLTALNVGLAVYYLRQFLKIKSLAGLAFMAGWTLHYVFGNLLALVLNEGMFGDRPFEDFQEAYLTALVLGQYFLVVYAYLLKKGKPFFGPRTQYPREAIVPLLIFMGVAFCLGAVFVLKIGVSGFFSRHLAFYRARLGDYAYEGIGRYYYLAMMVIPAVLMFVAYAMKYPTLMNRGVSAIGLLMVVALFTPMGGRGRVLNIFFILILTYFISRREYDLKKLLSWKMLLFGVVIVVGAGIWGYVRKDPTDEVEYSREAKLNAWVVDTTRLHFQSYILERYPLDGSFWPQHYIESVLGPFVKLSPLKPVNLIQDLSAQWYIDTIGVVGVQSAISPSLIGESYLTFGIAGLFLSPLMLYLVIKFVSRFFDCRHPLSIAVVLYFYQFTWFHGGMYSIFDLLVTTVPIFLGNRLLARPTPRPAPAPLYRPAQLDTLSRTP